MKKTGILTFHCADNYGAVLQCYAMQKYLEELGADAEVINYVPEILEEKYRTYTPFLKTFAGYKKRGMKNPFFRAVKTYCNNIYFLKKYKKHRSFEKFRKKHLKISEVCKSREEFLSVSEKYDMISVGSDQVWSKRIAGGEYNEVYFLDGVKEDVLRISYAASAGGNIAEEDKEKVKKLLENFDCISTREDSLASQLSEITGKDCVGVLDPVFLLSRKSWLDAFAKENPYKGKKYVLAYNVSIEPTVDEYFRLVDKAAEELGCEIYEIGKIKHFKGNGKVFSNVGPEEFIKLIEGAEFVFTTSFHATALAIVLEKQFNVFLPNNGSRVINILEKFGLRKKLITSGNTPDFEKIVYSEITEKFNESVNMSKKFIEDCLNDC